MSLCVYLRMKRFWIVSAAIIFWFLGWGAKNLFKQQSRYPSETAQILVWNSNDTYDLSEKITKVLSWDFTLTWDIRERIESSLKMAPKDTSVVVFSNNVMVVCANKNSDTIIYSSHDRINSKGLETFLLTKSFKQSIDDVIVPKFENNWIEIVSNNNSWMLPDWLGVRLTSYLNSPICGGITCHQFVNYLSGAMDIRNSRNVIIDIRSQEWLNHPKIWDWYILAKSGFDLSGDSLTANDLQHSFIYIGHDGKRDLFLSKLGYNGLEVTTLNQIFELYGRGKVFLAHRDER